MRRRAAGKEERHGLGVTVHPPADAYRRERPLFTVDAIKVEVDAWHVTVRQFPLTWTVAFERSEVESRARRQIAVDVGLHPDDFDLLVVWLGDAN